MMFPFAWRNFLIGALLLPALMLSATEGYEAQVIGGWTVLVDRGLQSAGDAERQAFTTVLTDQVTKLSRLPAGAQERLRVAVHIYVSSGIFRAFGAQHHPSVEWLTANGYPKDFAGHVEICNWREFTTLVHSQPFCLLHEMAHALHHLTPADDDTIRRAFDHARTANLYQQVTRGHGKELVQAYAITNYHEYFAELSEAYFGENDFAPYTNAELLTYDPVGHAMIAAVWGR